MIALNDEQKFSLINQTRQVTQNKKSGRRPNRGSALSRDLSTESDNISKHIGKSIKLPEYGFGTVTEFWSHSQLYVAYFWDVQDLTKECLLRCQSCRRGQLHLVLTNEELIYAIEHMTEDMNKR